MRWKGKQTVRSEVEKENSLVRSEKERENSLVSSMAR